MLSQLEQERDQVMCISVADLSNKSDAEYLLAPVLALHTAQQFDKVLLVFDDIVLHKFKEKQVFDLADQPFSSFNLANEIMARTGVFADGREVSSIVIIDENA